MVPDDMIAAPIAPGAVPDWVADQVADQALREEHALLIQRITETEITDADDPIELTALRIAILHHWRRLCLRNGGLAETLLAHDWEGAEARSVIADALTVLPLLELSDLEEAARSADHAADVAAG